jgi:hypothetical protein
MKIHQQKDKIQVVRTREKLLQVTLCLANSPVLKNRMLALEIKNALEELNKRAVK